MFVKEIVLDDNIVQTIEQLENDKIKIQRLPDIVRRLQPVLEHPMPAVKAFGLSFGLKKQTISGKYGYDVATATKRIMDDALDDVLMEHGFLWMPISVVRDLEDMKVDMFVLEHFVHLSCEELDKHIQQYHLTFG